MAAMGGLTLRGGYTTMKRICLLELQHEVRKMRWESWMDSPLFAGMGRDALCSLLRRLPWTRRHYARGDTVCEAGAGVEALGLVAAGSVYIESCDAWGERSLLGAVEAGQIFAEAYACLPGEPLMVRVVAAGDAEVIFLKAEALLREPPLARNLVELLARKNLQLSRRMRCTAPRTIRRRLMVYLSEEAAQQGSRSFAIPFNRQELADYLEVDRSALSTEISKMRQEGWLRAQGNNFVLTGPEA